MFEGLVHSEHGCKSAVLEEEGCLFVGELVIFRRVWVGFKYEAGVRLLVNLRRNIFNLASHGIKRRATGNLTVPEEINAQDTSDRCAHSYKPRKMAGGCTLV